MALSLAKAGFLKPEIKLAQALSEFEAVLPDDQKTKLRTYRGQSPPNPTDVMRFTAEIDRDGNLNRKSRQCVGPRLTNVLHAVQQFSTVVDLMVGASQSLIAGAVWGTVKISLQLASAYSSYFDQLSTLFMRIGLTCPRYQDFGLLYPKSARLQRALCEYFVVIVRLCKQAVVFLKKTFWSQLSSSILKPFESEFGKFHQDLEILAGCIREEVSLASNQAQQNEAAEMSSFRVFAKKFSTRDLEEARTWKRKKAELLFLNACSDYDHVKSWKQARKRGNVSWIYSDERYKKWKQEEVSSTLWCTGILGSGKTVLSANVVEDLRVTTSAAVAYFFCRHDDVKSLQARTIIGSIAMQLFDHVKSDIVDAIADFRPSTIDTDQILDYLQELLPSDSHKYFIIIDGLDECEEKETTLVLQCVKQLLMSRLVFQVYCSSRPDLIRWTHTLIYPQWNVFMPQASADIKEYVEDTLERHLDSGRLSVGDPTVILIVQDALLKKAHGMFLWVTFQIDSICSQKTDEEILAALEDLPKDLPSTFSRILRKLQNSNAADPYFGRKIFSLIAAAQRPLTLEELREAVSVKPGETTWNSSKLVNDIHKSLLDSCGSLVAVDEEHLTVHFAHHSVKQHLLSEPADLDVKSYHIDLEDADLYLGDTIVTYLNFGIFDQQLTKANPSMLPQVVKYPSAIFGSLPQPKVNKLAVRLLKRRGDFELDIRGLLKTAAGIVDESKEQTQPSHFFLPYAQEYWLFHTKKSKPTRVVGYNLWKRLINQEVNIIGVPWAPKQWNDFGDDCLEWMIQNEHWALIDQSLFEFAMSPIQFKAAEPLLKALAKKSTDLNFGTRYLNVVLFLVPHLKNTIKYFGNGLQEASNIGDRTTVEFLLENGADVNAESERSYTALLVASSKGHEEMVRLLLEKSADINAVSEKHGSALQAAIEGGHEDIARLLLENGADVNARDGRSVTALQAASSRGQQKMVRLLLEKSADINAVSEKHGSALQAAIEGGHEDIARLLLENGADVDAGTGKSVTVLQLASSIGQKETVRLLLEGGADINIASGIYGTPLEAAVRGGHVDIARLLLENGAGVNVRDGKSVALLAIASLYGDREMVKLLLEKGAYINGVRETDVNALRLAIGRSHEDITRLLQVLLENGAEVNAGSGKSVTVLQLASSIGQKETVRFLLEGGADINTASGIYGTPLQAAVRGGHGDVARFLLENGADVNAGSGKSVTALQEASSIGHKQMVRILLERGADINAACGKYGTPLQAAIFHEEIAIFLLENGADVNVEGGLNGSPLQAASSYNCEEIVRLLLKNGANVNAEGGQYGSALIAALAHGCQKIAKLLLDNGANDNAKNELHGSALLIASEKGYEEIVRLILKNGANVNAQFGVYKRTPLKRASRVGNKAIVELLLDSGAIADMEALTVADNEEVKHLIRKALQSQSS